MKRVAALKMRGKISPSRQDVSDTETWKTYQFCSSQCNPVNTITFRPWTFGLFYVVVVLTRWGNIMVQLTLNMYCTWIRFCRQSTFQFNLLQLNSVAKQNVVHVMWNNNGVFHFLNRILPLVKCPGPRAILNVVAYNTLHLASSNSFENICELRL